MKTSYRITCCYGGLSASEEKNSLLHLNPAVVVGTPGRILDHINRGSLLVGDIGTLILDEFDKWLEFGFQEEMAEIINHLSDLKKRILLSATDI